MHGIFGVSKKTQIQCQNILKHVMFLSTGWWFAPHLKATRQIGSFPPKDRGEPKKNVWNHHVVNEFWHLMIFNWLPASLPTKLLVHKIPSHAAVAWHSCRDWGKKKVSYMVWLHSKIVTFKKVPMISYVDLYEYIYITYIYTGKSYLHSAYICNWSLHIIAYMYVICQHFHNRWYACNCTAKAYVARPKL